MAAVFLITFLVIWFGFFREPEVVAPRLPSQASEFERVEIDFSLLESSDLRELGPFEAISQFKGEIGRENPFLPY